MLANRYRYLTSLSDELKSQSNRVRDLIGDGHWLSDGHHKEYLLLELLRRHLPSSILAARGFVISPFDPTLRSREQDILIVDTGIESPVFYQGGLAIVFPNSLLAAISVKTTMKRATILDSIAVLNSTRDIYVDLPEPRALWCGAFFFQIEDAIHNNPGRIFDYIDSGIKSSPITQPTRPTLHPSPIGPDLFCSSDDMVFRIDHGYCSNSDNIVPARILGYKCGGLGTAIFIAMLLDHIISVRKDVNAQFSILADVADVQPIPPATKQVDKIQMRSTAVAPAKEN